uniref:Max-like protein X n=1 Tax=Sus scrofa TaxID=9823 RepID=A0A8D1X8U6_PIG
MTEPGASPEDPWVKVEYAYSDNSLDPGIFVESTRKGSVVSRANSIGSTSASSVPNTDDEDSDYHQESYKESYKDRRRRAHTQAEQKRRDAIKRGYDDLQTIVPTCQQQDFSIGSQKLSKAIVLQKTIDYIQFLHKEKKKQEEEVSTLRKDVMALKIMKVNYEQIVKAHQDNPHEGEDQVSDQVKFNVFQGIMDSLFQSFNASISVASFQELSACVFSWIEEHCKPQVGAAVVTAFGALPSGRVTQALVVEQGEAAAFPFLEGVATAFRVLVSAFLYSPDFPVKVSFDEKGLSPHSGKAYCLAFV